MNRKNTSLAIYLHQVEHIRLKRLPVVVSTAVFGLLSALDKKPLIIDKKTEQKADIISSRYAIRMEPVYMTWETFRKKFFDEKDAFMNGMHFILERNQNRC